MQARGGQKSKEHRAQSTEHRAQRESELPTVTLELTVAHMAQPAECSPLAVPALYETVNKPPPSTVEVEVEVEVVVIEAAVIVSTIGLQNTMTSSGERPSAQLEGSRLPPGEVTDGFSVAKGDFDRPVSLLRC